MANIKSAIKRTSINEKLRQQNMAQKSALRTALKAFDKAVEGDNQADALAAFRYATKKLDKAASKGLIHKNAAARHKSIMAKRLNTFTA